MRSNPLIYSHNPVQINRWMASNCACGQRKDRCEWVSFDPSLVSTVRSTWINLMKQASFVNYISLFSPFSVIRLVIRAKARSKYTTLRLNPWWVTQGLLSVHWNIYSQAETKIRLDVSPNFLVECKPTWLKLSRDCHGWLLKVSQRSPNLNHFQFDGVISSRLCQNRRLFHKWSKDPLSQRRLNRS